MLVFCRGVQEFNTKKPENCTMGMRWAGYISTQSPWRLKFFSLEVVCLSVTDSQSGRLCCVNVVMAAGSTSSTQAQRYLDKCSFKARNKLQWLVAMPGWMRDKPNAPEPKIYSKFPSLLHRVRSEAVAEENRTTAKETADTSRGHKTLGL